ncbi:EEF1A lysine methyltransferase 1-like [Chenopodium quinoa]|uniref:Protein-lysine N-methyltransferase LOC110688830 n=1 Tax=Chenopodium quinoa TaxID=63459 RepID=A0A803MWC1_CHEQI|nr:EEF1A lysine methyltransferase 1-like [Chenopodium quinoa]
MDSTQNHEIQPKIQSETLKIEQREEDDDSPTLSPFALDALKEFLASQSISRTIEEKPEENNGEIELPLLSEDWRLSQFWYSPQTAITVASEVFSLFSQLNSEDPDVLPSVACISCPTLFIYLKRLYPTMSVQLLEYDTRFEQYGNDFTFYDYNLPEDLPQTMKHAYQIIVADPPYLSEECLKKVALTIPFLAKPEKNFLLLLTGEVQRDRASKFLGLHPCGFRPEHSSKLGNEFRVYTNYNPGERLGGWDLEE